MFARIIMVAMVAITTIISVVTALMIPFDDPEILVALGQHLCILNCAD
jgi:hypothetical protein